MNLSVRPSAATVLEDVGDLDVVGSRHEVALSDVSNPVESAGLSDSRSVVVLSGETGQTIARTSDGLPFRISGRVAGRAFGVFTITQVSRQTRVSARAMDAFTGRTLFEKVVSLPKLPHSAVEAAFVQGQFDLEPDGHNDARLLLPAKAGTFQVIASSATGRLIASLNPLDLASDPMQNKEAAIVDLRNGRDGADLRLLGGRDWRVKGLLRLAGQYKGVVAAQLPTNASRVSAVHAMGSTRFTGAWRADGRWLWRVQHAC